MDRTGLEAELALVEALKLPWNHLIVMEVVHKVSPACVTVTRRCAFLFLASFTSAK